MTTLHSTGETDDLGGGRYRLTQRLRRIAYDDAGTLKRIVDDWQDSGVPSLPHIVTAAPLIVSCAGDGTRRIHPTRELDRYIEIGAPFVKVGGVWTQPPLGVAQRTGNLLQWTTANANLYVWAGGHFVKFGLLFKGGWVPEDNQVAFPVGLTGLTRDGTAVMRDGVQVAELRRPHVEDLDDPLDIRPVMTDFVQLAGQWYALMTLPDMAGMGRPLLDPTLTLQPDATDGIDAVLRQTVPTTNAGAYDTLYFRGPGGSLDERPILTFDVSSIPAAATVSSATLQLYLTYVDADSNKATNLYQVLRNWVEAQVTWNIWKTGSAWSTAGCDSIGNDRQNTALATIADGAHIQDQFNDWDFNASGIAIVQGWVDGGTENDGAIGIQPGGNDTHTINVASSDNATAANRPKLVIVYTVGGAAPAMNHYRRRRGT